MGILFTRFVFFFCPAFFHSPSYLKLQVPTGCFIRRAVWCVLGEVVKVAVVQRSVHLTGQRGCERSDACGRTDGRWGILTVGVYGGSMLPWRRPSQLKPSNHLKDKKAGCHGDRLRSENERDASLLLVFLNILHSVFLISQPLWRIVPEKRPRRSSVETSFLVLQFQICPPDYLQSLLMRVAALLVIFLGNSIMSIPRRMML